MVRVFAAVGFGLLLGGCAGKSTSGGEGSGGYIEVGGKGSGGSTEAGGRGSGEAGSTSTGGAHGSAGGGGGSGGLVTSGEACSPEGAYGTNGCADCTCSQGAWSCGHKACPSKTCGGFIGSTCSSNEYCAYEAGQHCGAADASSTCQPRPDGCSDIYTPVCGCDGKTHSSICDAATQGTGVMSVGACPSAN